MNMITMKSRYEKKFSWRLFVMDSYLNPCDFAEDNILCKSGGMF